jgi:two-component system chemotaxis sensor kinase CheA
MKLDPEISQEELEVFLQEAYEQIELMDEDVVRLEKEKDNATLIQEIFRAAHTIKGSSAMVGHQTMTELTHAMENLLDKLRNHQIPVSIDIINNLLNSLDVLRVLVEEIDSSEDSKTDIEPALQKLRDISEADPGSSSPKVNSPVFQKVKDKILSSVKNGLKVYRINICISPESDWPTVRALQCLNELNNAGEVALSCPSEEELGEEDNDDLELEVVLIATEEAAKIRDVLLSITDIQTVEITPYEPVGDRNSEKGSINIPDSEDATAERNTFRCNDEKNSQSDFPRLESPQSIRVDVEVLDRLLNMVEELAIDRSKISQVGKLLEEKYSGDNLISELSATSDRIVKKINELEKYIVRIRMVPIGTIFSRFPRMVEDLAQVQNKKLDFIIEGADTELDRTVIEQIRDSLTHILRNAVDHGIESSEIRQSSGKPETGTIRLKAYCERGQITILIEDDGQGINSKKVIEAAINKGLVSQDKAESLTETEAVNLIFQPGISTVEKATKVSGRGVGLDIVRTNVESLGGSTSVETKIGKGCKLIIRLPLTTAIVQGSLLCANNTIYILPVESVVETMSIDTSMVQSIQGREIIRWNENLIPLVRLSSTIDSNDNNSDPQEKILIAVVTSDTGTIGLVIDELLGSREIVVRSPGNYPGNVESIAGTTIPGDGRVSFILDANSLVKRVVQSGGFSTISQGGSTVVV